MNTPANRSSDEFDDRDTDAGRTDEAGQSAEELLFDCLLSEAFGAATPPDQSRIIIRRLDETPIPIHAASAKTTKTPSKQSATWMVAVSIAAAVLLMLGAGLWIGQRGVQAVIGPATASEEDQDSSPLFPSSADSVRPRSAPPSLDRPTSDAQPSNTSEGQPSTPSSRPLTGIQLAGPTHTKAVDVDDSQTPAFKNTGDRSQPKETKPLAEVSTLVSKKLDHYWQRIHVQPTEKSESQQASQRLSRMLGWTLPADALQSSTQTLQVLQSSSELSEIAKRFLATMTQRPADALRRETDVAMVQSLAEVLRNRQPVDRLLAEWLVKGLQDTSQPTESWATLLKPLSTHEAIVASSRVLLGRDTRCTRCHDAMNSDHDTSTQHRYWQFAATMAPYLQIKTNGSNGWFYDDPDGRRRLAKPIEDTELFAESLVGSEELATGLVETMWRLLHGRPLVASPYDMSGPTQDDALLDLRQLFVTDLVEGRFDLLRTLSLMIQHSPLLRRTPDALAESGLLVSSDELWNDAIQAVESHAAAAPQAFELSASERMKLARSMVRQLNGSNQLTGKDVVSVLAQPLSPIPGQSQASRVKESQPQPSPAHLAGLPMRAMVSLPAWLRDLPDTDSRLAHVGYLASLQSIPPNADKMVQAMQDAGLDESMVLHRLWWLLHP